jgi:hypothetical protein
LIADCIGGKGVRNCHGKLFECRRSCSPWANHANLIGARYRADRPQD